MIIWGKRSSGDDHEAYAFLQVIYQNQRRIQGKYV